MNPVPAAVTDALAWLVVGTFLGSVALRRADRTEGARVVASAGWVGFAAFWATLVPTFLLEMRSAVEGVGSIVAVPACAYAGYLLYDGRESLQTLTTAVAVMGLLYLPVETLAVVRRPLVETVAAQSHALAQLAGYDPTLTAVQREGPVQGYRSLFTYTDATGHEYTTYIVTACTGIGSMAIFGGLVAAVEAPLRRKLVAFATAVGIIWVLNLCRNAFIATAFGRQWFQHDALVWVATEVVGYADPRKTSYFVADRVIAQSLAVVALVGITYLLVRILPELLDVLAEALFVVTGTEYDLREELGVEPASGPTRADGGPGAVDGDTGAADDPGADGLADDGTDGGER